MSVGLVDDAHDVGPSLPVGFHDFQRTVGAAVVHRDDFQGGGDFGGGDAVQAAAYIAFHVVGGDDQGQQLGAARLWLCGFSRVGGGLGGLPHVFDFGEEGEAVPASACHGVEEFLPVSVLAPSDSPFQDAELVPDGQAEEQPVGLLAVLDVAGIACLVVEAFRRMCGGLVYGRVVVLRCLMAYDAVLHVVAGVSGAGDSRGEFYVVAPDEEFLDGQPDLAYGGCADKDGNERAGQAFAYRLALSGRAEGGAVHGMRGAVCPLGLATGEAGVLFAGNHVHEFLQGVRGGDGVIVHDPVEVAALQHGSLDSEGESTGAAYVLWKPDNFNSAVVLSREKVFRAVCGTVVYDDNLIDGIALCLHRSQAFFQQGQTVMGDYDAIRFHAFRLVYGME